MSQLKDRDDQIGLNKEKEDPQEMNVKCKTQIGKKSKDKKRYHANSNQKKADGCSNIRQSRFQSK